MAAYRAPFIVAFVLIACFSTSFLHLSTLVNFKNPQNDLNVYYTAASLVRNHQGQNIYSGADTGEDPQRRQADPNTIFATKARALGIETVHLYVYPPTLADLAVPLTFLSIRNASIIWKFSNIALLLSVALTLIRTLGMRPFGLESLATLALVLIFRPSLEALQFGQITILLLALETFGMILYVRGNQGSAALLFAVASAIKLTPLIVIVPLIAWRDWKTLRSLALWVFLIFAGLCLLNGPNVLTNYVQHVLPAMAGGILDVENRNLSSALRVFWRDFAPVPSPMWLSGATKILSLLVIAYAGWQSQAKRAVTSEYRLSVLALFLVLSCCLAPVAWQHAYVATIPAIVILLKRLLDKRLRLAETILFVSFVLSINTGLIGLAQTTGKAALADLNMMTPLIGVALVIMQLWRLAADRPRQSKTPEVLRGCPFPGNSQCLR